MIRFIVTHAKNVQWFYMETTVQKGTIQTDLSAGEVSYFSRLVLPRQSVVLGNGSTVVM